MPLEQLRPLTPTEVQEKIPEEAAAQHVPAGHATAAAEHAEGHKGAASLGQIFRLLHCLPERQHMIVTIQEQKGTPLQLSVPSVASAIDASSAGCGRMALPWTRACPGTHT